MPTSSTLSRVPALALAATLGVLLLAGPASAAPTTARSVKPVKKLKLVRNETVRPFAAKRSRVTASASTLHFHGGFPGASSTGLDDPPQAPEVGGAVSSAQFMQVDSEAVTVFSRNGPVQERVSLEGWCGPGSEARVLYDRRLQRWFMAMIADTNPQVLCVYTSRTSNATGDWHVVAFVLPVPAGGSGRNLRLGMDGDAVFLTFDQFTSSGSYQHSGAVAMGKPELVAGDFPAVGLYDALPPLVPPVVVDSAFPSSYFVYAPPSGNKLQLWAATAMHRGGLLTRQADVTVPSYTSPSAAAMPEQTATLDTGDANFPGSSYQIGTRLVNAHTINRSGHPTNRWYTIEISDSTLVRSGRLFESSTSDDFSPSVAASDGGTCGCERPGAVFFTWTSTDARNPTPAKRHDPRMRAAAWVPADTTANRSGSAVITGDAYAPVPDAENGWGRSQVTLSPRGYGDCVPGTQAFAIGPRAIDKERFGAYIRRIGTC